MYVCMYRQDSAAPAHVRTRADRPAAHSNMINDIFYLEFGEVNIIINSTNMNPQPTTSFFLSASLVQSLAKLIYIYIYIHIHICIYIHIHICIYINTYIHINTYIYMHVCV